ncbi:MAG: hypothetical protein EOO22_14465, partial [Comamonadaceae bacterium]
QYLDDQQTHVLMGCDDDLGWIARTMRFSDCCPFLHELDAHRELVAQEFDTLLGGAGGECKGCHGPKAARAPAPDLDAIQEQLPPQLRERVAAWSRNPRVMALREDARARLSRLVARTGQWLEEGRVSEEAALRMADWVEPLLRRAHHAEVFRTLARDVEGVLTVEQVADDLSALADAVLRVTARWCWQRLKNRHRETPSFGIIGYGKLGGKELGYGSDLDIVFVFDDEDERAPEVYANFVRKLINWLTVKTGEGDLYEIDTALRPNGSSGLLVTTFAAYANYQEGRGSNTAWTWEHQAMTRARFVLGEAALAHRFDGVREAVITAPRDVRRLREEIVAMRERVRAAHPVKDGWFDVKHSPGGMVDAEFAVQFLVLAQSGQHPGLVPNVGNIALLQRAEGAGLLPPGVGEG